MRVKLMKDFAEVHFLVAGPEGTWYDGGIYHGVMKLPTDYPYHSPTIVMTTPNGRFELNSPLCIEGYTNNNDWSPAKNFAVCIRAVRSIFSQLNEKGSGFWHEPTKGEANRHKEASKKFMCKVCGMDHSTLQFAKEEVPKGDAK